MGVIPTLLVAAATTFAIGATPVLAQSKGKNGTTLAAYKTIDICEVSPATGDAPALWRYFGEISIWNEGALDTLGLAITDCIQNKVGSGQFEDAYCAAAFDPVPTVIPAGTTLETATVFKYVIEGEALAGYIRNSAQITILNHSGHLDEMFGPNPKATYLGVVPPSPCPTPAGCVYTQGYWGSKPNVTWPVPYTRDAIFFLSGKTWQQVLDAPTGGNGYYILAHQYIAAVLNQANFAAVPTGVQDTLDLANAWFVSKVPGDCPKGSSCGEQKTWAGVLDSYNNGEYPGGPPHCGDE